MPLNIINNDIRIQYVYARSPLLKLQRTRIAGTNNMPSRIGKNDANDISNKVADFTQDTIKQLIEKGEHDALDLFESKY
jgi:hypothetical protein